MISLPFDVFMEILPLIDYHDLPVLARANRNMSILALDRLYASIPAKHFVAAGTSISANSALALRVRSLEITREEHEKVSNAVLIPLLQDVFAATTNLRNLVLHLQGTFSVVLRSARFKLQTLSCTTFTDQHLVTFLRDQADLEELTLTHSLVPMSSRDSRAWNLPNLRRFTGSMTWVDSILPCTPLLSHLVITSTRAGRQDMEVLGTVPLQHLQIPFNAVDGASPAQMKRLLPHVQSLTLELGPLWRTFLVPTSTTGATTEHWLVDVLPSLSTVRCVSVLGFNPSNGDTTTQNTVEFIRRVTARASTVCEFSVRFGRATSADQSTWVWKRVRNDWEGGVVAASI
ncbi:hypothetical protein C8F01DRAFT_1154651 [Mycena amicta]|nr:hypothetical protein C8F01DRAFT_1154651 [Mycena amicta]